MMTAGPAQSGRSVAVPVVAILVCILLLAVVQQPMPVSGQASEQPELVLAIVGTNVTLTCASTSDTIRWTRDGLNLTADDPDAARFVAHKIYHQPTAADDQSDPDGDEGDTNAGTDYDGDSSAAAGPQQQQAVHRLNITNVQLGDAANYTCLAGDEDDDNYEQTFAVQPTIEPRLVAHSERVVRTRISQSVQFYCLFEAYPLDRYNATVHWHRVEDDAAASAAKSDQKTPVPPLTSRTQMVALNATLLNVTLDISDVFKKDNGTYVCTMRSPWTSNPATAATATSSLLVLDVPQVSIDHVKAVGAHKIFLNWTINDGNDPVTKYFLQYMKENTTAYTYFNDPIDGHNLSYVLDGFEPLTEYQLQITAKNALGMGPAYTYPAKVRTLAADPVFVPQIGVKGNTHSTITIGWQPPPADMLEFINYYEVVVADASNQSRVIDEAFHPQNSRNLPYMFDNLRTATEYLFRVRSCSELTKLCGDWSETVSGTTMDGTASAPQALQVQCAFYNISGRTTVSATWKAPAKPNGNITLYNIVLDGLATFRWQYGWRNETYGPKSKHIEGVQFKADYENVPPNTNYTVRVSAMTRSKRPGEMAVGTCRMRPTVPADLGRSLWGKVRTETGSWVFKMFLSPVSERNGPICGYRVYLVRLGRHANRHLGTAESLPIMSYAEAHAANNTRGGAYIAEILSRDNFQTELFLGDGQRVRNNETAIALEPNESCRKLLGGYYERTVATAATTTTTTTSTEATAAVLDGGDDDAMDIPVPPPISTQKEQLDRAGNLTPEANKILNTKNRRRRRRRETLNSVPTDAEKSAAISADTVTTTQPSIVAAGAADSISIEAHSTHHQQVVHEIIDGPLDPHSDYTAMIEVIVLIDQHRTASAFSALFETRTGGAPPVMDTENARITNLLNIATQVLCGLILLVLVLLVALYIWHRYSKSAVQGDEIISLRDSLSRAFCGGRSGHNHRHLIGSSSTKPGSYDVQIGRADLPLAFAQKRKDTDYGFRCEFEVLPPRFNDRTTKHSDAKENQFKNRYPDIKAYDQTRVRLAERNGTIGSDYINANFVLGYKERKKFICAQGPMDSTIGDFWRMIWEQHLEIIVMLTNLEEYNKTKCAKYWPEKVADTTKFGDITVTFTDEQRFSDYLVRHLKITRRSTSNGNAGGGSTASAAESGEGGGGGATVAAVAASDETEDCRHITQYHYLVWKDFSAPEHPHGILKFIRQINSVYSLQRGPILVHCSAGVGRTGTLVALDSLMQQLEEEGHVSIFNVVCDMRHQRNFLVQSLKQYIFLYRALLDLAQFGNTEIQAKDLNATVEALKIKSNDSKEQCKLELEFERIKTIKDDTSKTFAVGVADENRDKNRSDAVIPFDGNRVILTPIPSREHSTYINASFVEGYDNSESFIITQDPLDDTIADFWRMISEQGINTIVMISEIGDGPRKCPRYWADEEIQYDHIQVQYMHSESCPYYTRREFNVTNCKLKDTIKVTQFQYNGWPTVDGEVPEVARGMIELVDQAQNHHNGQDSYASIGPIVVHCNLGTERSSIYVAMCILVQHLRTEKKVDICTVTRKLRSQRHSMLDSYAQYEFLHRAIVNYADLHRTSLELPSGDC